MPVIFRGHGPLPQWTSDGRFCLTPAYRGLGWRSAKKISAKRNAPSGKEWYCTSQSH
ncbi:hypothetical protein SRABI70_04252 [Pseudomonas sp. Bi70]|nr:hypothetical protein SRABI70_04252 [Pseudomonas sp. Bi70]